MIAWTVKKKVYNHDYIGNVNLISLHVQTTEASLHIHAVCIYMQSDQHLYHSLKGKILNLNVIDKTSIF